MAGRIWPGALSLTRVNLVLDKSRHWCSIDGGQQPLTKTNQSSEHVTSTNTTQGSNERFWVLSCFFALFKNIKYQKVFRIN